MLMRFYEASKGFIYLNNYAVEKVNVQSLRDKISVVFQEALIFDGTVKENIEYGKPDATDEEIIEAAKRADAHEFIEQMSEGYDTNVGQKGRNLSGGQQQRLAIARAIIKNTSVLILDEPADGLDGSTEKRVMKDLMRDTATLIITHNLKTAREADKILYIYEGEIKEIGTYDELMALNGKYKNLYNDQQGDDIHEDVMTPRLAVK